MSSKPILSAFILAWIFFAAASVSAPAAHDHNTDGAAPVGHPVDSGDQPVKPYDPLKREDRACFRSVLAFAQRPQWSLELKSSTQSTAPGGFWHRLFHRQQTVTVEDYGPAKSVQGAFYRLNRIGGGGDALSCFPPVGLGLSEAQAEKWASDWVRRHGNDCGSTAARFFEFYRTMYAFALYPHSGGGLGVGENDPAHQNLIAAGYAERLAKYIVKEVGPYDPLVSGEYVGGPAMAIAYMPGLEGSHYYTPIPGDSSCMGASFYSAFTWAKTFTPSTEAALGFALQFYRKGAIHDLPELYARIKNYQIPVALGGDGLTETQAFQKSMEDLGLKRDGGFPAEFAKQN